MVINVKIVKTQLTLTNLLAIVCAEIVVHVTENVNMARKFKSFVERAKPKKRVRTHKKSLNKDEKRSYKKYNRQGRRPQ